MTRGRPRKPASQKKAQGTYRKDRDQSLQLSEGIPDPPGYLSPQALIHWDRMIEITRAARTLTEADGDALAMLCLSFEEYRAADIIVRDEGEICRTEHTTKDGRTYKGGPYQHPAVGIRTNAWKKIVRLLREFGLTPSARSGMKMTASGKEENPIAEALKEMRKHALN